MDKAYLRRLQETDQFQITFQCNNPVYKLNRQFNFQRRLSETADAFLLRITANVQRVIDKKHKKKSDVAPTPLKVELFVNGTLVSDEITCEDLFKAGNLVELSLLDNKYEIVIDAPYVDALLLPKSMLANFPVYPTKFETAFTDKKLCEFVWFKSTDKNKWEQIDQGFTCTPGNGVINNYLKLTCLPKNDTSEGPIAETVSEGVVSASPGLCPFEMRHQFTQDKCHGNEFRVVTYNILADLYCDSDHTRTELYPYCPPYALALDYRKQLILKEVLGYNADVICMQEVDRKVYNYDFEHLFKMLNYDSHYTIKGGSVAEGVACFFNTKKFSLVETSSMVLSEQIGDSIYAELYEAIMVNEKLKERFLERQTAAQLTVLRDIGNGNILLIANTHLYFHPDADHIRLLQGGMCIKYVENAYKRLLHTYSDKVVSVMFCGDFNSTPECGIYKLYTSGQVDSDCIDWKSNQEEAVRNLSISQSIQLASACGTPTYTNFTAGFADCLDYIFYDKTKMAVTQVIPLPSDEDLTRHTALPSIVFPSDHIPLVADLKWL